MISSQYLLIFFILSSHLYFIIQSVKEIKPGKKVQKMIKKVFQSKVQKIISQQCLLTGVGLTIAYPY